MYAIRNDFCLFREIMIQHHLGITKPVPLHYN
ncbi:MAG: hypothetical protein K0Q94_2055 [Paenibacillus sp.]|jgi:hypothetical protein|nr:hypothetical protein [Paenibacillus sp.]